MINDFMNISNPTYSDINLQKTLIVAGRLVLGEADFTQDFNTDIDTLEITPDPTLSATQDDNFINLTCMKAACMIDRGETILATKKGIVARDGTGFVDMRSLANARLELLRNGGWCKVYDDSLSIYILGAIDAVGAAIMGPFRVYQGMIGRPPNWIY